MMVKVRTNCSHLVGHYAEVYVRGILREVKSKGPLRERLECEKKAQPVATDELGSY
jgi:hypothetical protein